jgi:hypothetical protein
MLIANKKLESFGGQKAAIPLFFLPGYLPGINDTPRTVHREVPASTHENQFL